MPQRDAAFVLIHFFDQSSFEKHVCALGIEPPPHQKKETQRISVFCGFKFVDNYAHFLATKARGADVAEPGIIDESNCGTRQYVSNVFQSARRFFRAPKGDPLVVKLTGVLLEDGEEALAANKSCEFYYYPEAGRQGSETQKKWWRRDGGGEAGSGQSASEGGGALAVRGESRVVH